METKSEERKKEEKKKKMAKKISQETQMTAVLRKEYQVKQ